MTPEKDAPLCQRYPKIFADRHADLSVSLMGFGLAVRDGWLDLIDRLCAQLQSISDQPGAPQVVALQVKEKFGSLSFYVRGANDEHMAAIAAAARESKQICEICGAGGNLVVVSGCWMTRCDAHTPSESIEPEEFRMMIAERGRAKG